ncbi:MAG: hypothetical protein NVSMB12_18710 [Acidimicrobiales bacterium]
MEERSQWGLGLEGEIAVPDVGSGPFLGVERKDFGVPLDTRLDGMGFGRFPEA